MTTHTHEDMSGRLEGAAIRKYIMAGNARFTIRNNLTGGRFTYRVAACKDDKPERAKVHFVSILMGDNNETDYSYIGFIRDGRFFHGGRKSRASYEAPSVIAFGWFWRMADQLPAAVECWHEGRCGRCGRVLTVPESIRDGIGPECARRVGRRVSATAAQIETEEDEREKYKAALQDTG